MVFYKRLPPINLGRVLYIADYPLVGLKRVIIATILIAPWIFLYLDTSSSFFFGLFCMTPCITVPLIIIPISIFYVVRNPLKSSNLYVCENGFIIRHKPIPFSTPNLKIFFNLDKHVRYLIIAYQASDGNYYTIPIPKYHIANVEKLYSHLPRWIEIFGYERFTRIMGAFPPHHVLLGRRFTFKGIAIFSLALLGLYSVLCISAITITNPPYDNAIDVYNHIPNMSIGEQHIVKDRITHIDSFQETGTMVGYSENKFYTSAGFSFEISGGYDAPPPLHEGDWVVFTVTQSSTAPGGYWIEGDGGVAPEWQYRLLYGYNPYILVVMGILIFYITFHKMLDYSEKRTQMKLDFFSPSISDR